MLLRSVYFSVSEAHKGRRTSIWWLRLQRACNAPVVEGGKAVPAAVRAVLRRNLRTFRRRL